MISLANHFPNLAQKTVPNNYHMHFDGNNSLEEGSVDLIVQAKDIPYSCLPQLKACIDYNKNDKIKCVLISLFIFFT